MSRLVLEIRKRMYTIEVHGGNLGFGWSRHENVERLGLVNEGSAISSHINKIPLRNLPNGAIKLLQIVRNLCDSLNGATSSFTS